MQVSHRRFFMPITKVDAARRTVWGIAQSESVDTQDDLLTYEASVSAFTAWQGNIREQHDDSKAVGKAVQVIGDPTARTITVGAKISLGAEDTWQKVLDGTLTGFSIGGLIQDSSIEHSEELGRNIRKVTRYELFELSLVDVPANSLCVVTAIQKRGNHLVATDVLTQSTGALTVSDLLTSLSQKASHSMPNKKRAKVQPVVAFAKSLEPKDEVVLVRVSDLQKSQDGKTVFLKGSAPISGVIKKEDFDADGYNDESDDTEGDDNAMSEIDFGKHAEDAAQIHKSMCKMAGIDDDEAHYIEATKDEDDDKTGDALDTSKSRGARTKARAEARKLEIAKRATQSETDAKIATLSKQVEELTKALSGKGGDVVAPRVGAEAGSTVVEKAAATVAPDERAAMQKSLDDLRKQQSEMLQKGVRNFTDEDRAKGQALNEQVMKLEIALNGKIPVIG